MAAPPAGAQPSLVLAAAPVRTSRLVTSLAELDDEPAPAEVAPALDAPAEAGHLMPAAEAIAPALDALIGQLAGSRPALQPILARKAFRLEPGRLVLGVVNGVEAAQVAEARDLLVPALRALLSHPSLQLTAEADPALAPSPEAYMTDEDRLRALEERNPHFQHFLKTFNTTVYYG